jgi:hypothetical protein
MGTTIFANSGSTAKKGSGKAVAVFPDVCKVPAPPAPPAPIPFPHIAKLEAASKKVKQTKTEVQQKSKLSGSSGDQAGVQKGILSSRSMGRLGPFTQVDIGLKEIEDLLTGHRKNLQNAPRYRYLQAKQIQDRFERTLQGKLKALQAVARSEPALAPAVRQIAKIVEAAAKGS